VPEEIHPGVFVEEGPAGVSSIEGVDTSTAGFVGATAIGQMDSPVYVTSLAELERVFGDRCDVVAAGRAFFAHGGARLVVQPVVDDDFAGALRALEQVTDVSLIAAPGAPIVEALVEHAERMRYRIALIDAPVDDALALRERVDSSYAAVFVGKGLDAPASGYGAAAYARTPAHEAPTGGGDVEPPLERLVEAGINVVTAAGGVVGNRTLSSDPEWKYVSLRRYFAYLEHSLDRGTQWTVFEPNGERLWEDVRRTIEGFLLTEWRRGALRGTKPEEAFFVRCDRTTMTQNDLDDGRLVGVVGVAPLRPAEFVIIRIGRWTADHC
jgi:phage tail sheath protein FI